MTRKVMSDKELKTTLEDLFKIGYLAKSKKEYSFNKDYIIKKAEFVKSRGKYKMRIELLYILGYFAVPRTAREVANMVQVMML